MNAAALLDGSILSHGPSQAAFRFVVSIITRSRMYWQTGVDNQTKETLLLQPLSI